LQDKLFSNLWWLTWGAFDPNDPADVHITWRNEWSHMLGEKSRTKYIWLHDSLKVLWDVPNKPVPADIYSLRINALL
jgi:hypothetical protein